MVLEIEIHKFPTSVNNKINQLEMKNKQLIQYHREKNKSNIRYQTIKYKSSETRKRASYIQLKYKMSITTTKK